MIIGDKRKFAAEFDLDDNYSKLLDGTFTYWINSQRLVSEKESVYLNDVYMSMIWFNYDLGHRKYAEHITDDLNKIFEDIYDSIYNSDTFDSCPARYDISINVNGIDRYTIFYIEDNSSGYLLYKENTDDVVNTFKIEKGEVDNVLSDTFSELNRLYESVH